MKSKKYTKRAFIFMNLLSDAPHVFQQFFRITATASNPRITATFSNIRITAFSDY